MTETRSNEYAPTPSECYIRWRQATWAGDNEGARYWYNRCIQAIREHRARVQRERARAEQMEKGMER